MAGESRHPVIDFAHVHLYRYKPHRGRVGAAGCALVWPDVRHWHTGWLVAWARSGSPAVV